MRPLLLALALATVAACGDDTQILDDARRTDAHEVDAGGDPDAACFTNPTTHEQIINACTTAEKIYKDPVLPLQLPDGGLPPLP